MQGFIMRILYLLLCIGYGIVAADHAPHAIAKLNNPDDRCYLNSTLQTIDNIPILRSYLDNAYTDISHNKDQSKPLLASVAGARYYMQQPLYANTFERQCDTTMKRMQEETGTTTRQQDATELLRKVIAQLEDHYPGNEALQTLCNVYYDTDIRDPRSQQRLNTRQQHTAWPLQIGPFSDEAKPTSDANIPSLIYHYSFAASSIEYRSQTTGRVHPDAVKHDKVIQLPQYLTVQITPYAFTQEEQTQQLYGETPEGTPLTTTIYVPEYMRYIREDQENASFADITCPLISHDYGQEKAVTYRLNSGIIYQKFASGGGHYWAYVRKGNSWYRCDDAHIEGPEEGITAFPYAWTPSSSIAPYLLVYERTEESIPEIPTQDTCTPHTQEHAEHEELGQDHIEQSEQPSFLRRNWDTIALYALGIASFACIFQASRM